MSGLSTQTWVTPAVEWTVCGRFVSCLYFPINLMREIVFNTGLKFNRNILMYNKCCYLVDVCKLNIFDSVVTLYTLHFLFVALKLWLLQVYVRRPTLFDLKTPPELQTSSPLSFSVQSTQQWGVISLCFISKSIEMHTKKLRIQIMIPVIFVTIYVLYNLADRLPCNLRITFIKG